MPRYGEPNDPTPHCPPELVERANRRLAARALAPELRAAMTSPVWRYMQERYANDGWVLFAESSFAENTVGGDPAARRQALEALERAGLVTSTVRLTCPEGHTIWEGQAQQADGAAIEHGQAGCISCMGLHDTEPDVIDVEDIGRELYWHLVIGPGATPKRPEPPTAQELAKALLELTQVVDDLGYTSPDLLWQKLREKQKTAEVLLKRCPEGWLR